jgi:hypothetical protein
MSVASARLSTRGGAAVASGGSYQPGRLLSLSRIVGHGWASSPNKMFSKFLPFFFFFFFLAHE